MTKVGQLFEQEKISYGNKQRKAGIEDVAKNCLKLGMPATIVMEATRLTQDDIDRILGKTESVAT